MTRQVNTFTRTSEPDIRTPPNAQAGAVLATPAPPERGRLRPGAGQVLARLRAETRDLHTRLEGRFDAIAALRRPGGPGEVCARFYALHQPLDAVLAAWLSDVAGLLFERRRRMAGLTASLMRLGAAAPVGACRSPPPPESRAEALGLLYVLEGSTLGGRVILRQLAATGMDLDGLDFLDPYGADSGRMWRQLLEILERYAGGNEAAIDQAVRGARRGFTWAEGCLCGASGRTGDAT